jgi:hypothetical protein
MIYAKELFSFILVLDDNEESPDKDAVDTDKSANSYFFNRTTKIGE